jgi:hypothetical protein
MWWKIIAIFYAFLYSWTVFQATSYVTTYRVIGTVIGLPAAVGLILFAFNKRLLSGRFWKSFTVIYIGYVAVGLLIGAKKLIFDQGIGIRDYAIAVAISFVFQFPIILSLWRLSFAPAQSGPRQFGRTAAP